MRRSEDIDSVSSSSADDHQATEAADDWGEWGEDVGTGGANSALFGIHQFSAQCSSTCEYNCLIYRTLGALTAAGSGDADTDEGSYMTLFCEMIVPTPEQAFEHDSREYGFDMPT
jgi:hypothetical protein